MTVRVTPDELRVLQERIRRGKGEAATPCNPATVPRSRPAAALPYRSKLEASYADYLESQRVAGLIVAWAYEPIKIRLPARRCWYTVDFLVQTAMGLEGHEVKGFPREEAMLKLKLAARAAWWLPLVLVQRRGRTWWEWTTVMK